mmetsp:Transcript_24647/g.69307  ORF Transcript_24647/g.69307 Transcript_24647/m.69307 type:complete len:371 (-) Transcript_24647:679-1791(-)
MRRYSMLCRRSTHVSTRSIIFKPCEKISMRWPREISAGSRAATQRSFALCAITDSKSPGSFRSSPSTAFPTSTPSVASSSTCPSASSSSCSAGARSGHAPPPPSAPVASFRFFALRTSAPPGTPCAGPARYSCQLPGWVNGSPSAGWLQSRFSKPIALKTSRPSLVLQFASRMTSLVARAFLYICTCSLVGSNHTTSSLLGGSAFAAAMPLIASVWPGSPSPPTDNPMLCFVRRSMWGWTSCHSCSQRCCFRATAEELASRRLPFSMGSLKRFTNVAWLPRRQGCAKSMSAQMSFSPFCTGVPVRRTRHLEWTLRSDFPRSVEMVLITWASSQMTTSQAFSQGSPPSRFFAAPSPNTGLARGSATDTFSR